MSQLQEISDRVDEYKKSVQIGPSTVPRLLPAMPIKVLIGTFKVAFSYEREGDDVVFRVIQPQIDNREDFRWLDAYSIRDLFLRIGTPEEALDFLTVTGYFRWSEKGDSNVHLTVKWSDLKLWQELIRLRMTKRDLESWLIYDDSGKVVGRDWDVSPHFKPILKHLTDQESSRLEGWSDKYYISPCPSKSNRRQMELVAQTEECNSTLEAMFAVVNIDHLKGINYRLCKLSGCDNIFEVKRPDKVYCGHPCAHKAHVYEKRDEARKKATLARKAAQRTGRGRK